jgi:hypothetical protein
MARLGSLAAMWVASVGLGIAACERPSHEEPVEPLTRATLHVENSNWLDAVIYGVRSGTLHRLGDVRSFQSDTFELPPAVTATGEVRLVVELIGTTSRYVSPTVILADHSVVELYIAGALNLSSVSVWPATPDEP